MGLKISPDELEAALSGSSRNIRLEKMLASWTSQIKDLMLELADKKEADKDVKDIRTILQERLFGLYTQASPQGAQLRLANLGSFKLTSRHTILRRYCRVPLEASCRGCLYPC